MMKLTPQSAPEGDGLFNRRRLAFWGIAFSVYWVHVILLVHVFTIYKAQASDAVIITAFLAVPTSLAGLGFFKYLRAAENDDAFKTSTLNTSIPSDSSTTVIVKNSSSQEPIPQSTEPKSD